MSRGAGTRVKPDAEVRAQRRGDRDERIEAGIGNTGLDPPYEASIEAGSLSKVRDGGWSVGPQPRDVGPNRASNDAEAALYVALHGSIPQWHRPSKTGRPQRALTCLPSCRQRPNANARARPGRRDPNFWCLRSTVERSGPEMRNLEALLQPGGHV